MADGLGSGTWAKINSVGILGLSGDGGSTNKKLITNGTNGFNMETAYSYGAMALTNNAVPFVVGAAADPTLQATGDYVLFTGIGAPWAGENNFGVVFNGVDRLTFTHAGVYMLNAYANISVYPNVNAFVGARFKINGVTFTPRTAITKSNGAGDQGHIVGAGLATFAANDYAQLYVASTFAGNLVIRNFVITFNLVRPL